MKALCHTLGAIFGQVLALGLIPGAIAVALMLRPGTGSELAADPLLHDDTHAFSCPVCARTAAEAVGDLAPQGPTFWEQVGTPEGLRALEAELDRPRRPRPFEGIAAVDESSWNAQHLPERGAG